ncbi:MAG: hypothetical protein H7123_08940 [Thermoleophilia bacterium]|nr:hypothetical protein [Thermoleophilia bacterium]
MNSAFLARLDNGPLQCGGATGVWDNDSIDLLGAISRMTVGKDFRGREIGRGDAACVGAVVNPTDRAARPDQQGLCLQLMSQFAPSHSGRIF